MSDENKNKFFGNYQLVGAEFQRSNGKNISLKDGDVAGMLLYDTKGNMSVQYMNSNKAVLETGIFDDISEEIKSAFGQFLAYFGTYEVDFEKNIVTHKLEGSNFPQWVNNGQKRLFDFSNDLLTLSTPHIPAGKETLKCSFIWKKFV